jgi:hypothetical protein
MAGSSNRRRAADEAEGSRAGARRRQGSSTSFMIYLRFPYVSDHLLCFRLIQWNPAPAPAMNQPLTDDSSESNNYSLVPYGEQDGLRFKAERDESRRELGEMSKKACITEIEWKDQRKQLLATIDGMSLRSTFNPIHLFDTDHHCFATLQPATPSLSS